MKIRLIDIIAFAIIIALGIWSWHVVLGMCIGVLLIAITTEDDFYQDRDRNRDNSENDSSNNKNTNN